MPDAHGATVQFLFFILIYLFVSPVEVLATAGGEEMEEGGEGLSV